MDFFFFTLVFRMSGAMKLLQYFLQCYMGAQLPILNTAMWVTPRTRMEILFLSPRSGVGGPTNRNRTRLSYHHHRRRNSNNDQLNWFPPTNSSSVDTDAAAGFSAWCLFLLVSYMV
jgi:hypothetical protein